MELSPIVLIEDDKDDCEFIIEALNEAGAKNEVRCFSTPIPALEYLRSTHEKAVYYYLRYQYAPNEWLCI